ncbi:bifunctional 2',3'-cyclic-nucleotide 2'-phosphodiesterase/3'-nucleotidase [Lederbergia citrea]|uniref:Bifunctional 2',3'-cyclic-nucleotide 2'-phosphodiesterase/3'-nucleotidase n=1 Tax=Lederbergia citrea TaxID=2833581 RepID=A0A942UL73_9BACI|nr:bifunctional 2',3'-cyclic-nucleotide 2'-phosphodiesterase/3'-nucleotidase [Lederbergia citrea]MBS4204133.1 bifunctional 2',3'-cyclic-nucleotide 2'-phosphodiesterase/3'-nucleotidase [Lederbergia citrea]MBS4221282.1 bifunctional 2',3'-cyclic-nucleotide 2'-phosphodiesterase/3'-nucleotidase [Lederbergia citrea]
MRSILLKIGQPLLASLLAISVLFLPLASQSTYAEKPDKTKKDLVELRILGTTDIHTHLYNYDYYKDAETDEFGLAKTATLIKEARKEAKNTLLFDDGDLIQGNPLGDYKAKVDELKQGEVHPVFKAMGLLNYDAATVGNHEFNYGLDYLDKVLAGAPFPYVNANVYKVDGKKNNKNYFKPYIILKKQFIDEQGKKQKINVGVIGFVTPQITQWDKAHLEGKVITKDIVETAKEFIPKMKKDGADIIVALAHSGIGEDEQKEFKEDAAYDLTKIKDIDAIISGHNHKLFPGDFQGLPGVNYEKGTINGKPVIMPGSWGSHLGVMDLTLKKEKGDWKVIDALASLRAIYDKDTKKSLADADPKILEAVKKEHEGTVNYVRQPVGETTADIHSYFALVQDDPSIQIVTNAQKWYLEKQIEGTPNEGLPILSVGAPFKAGGRNGANYYTHIPKGTIAIKNVADLYLYPNTVAHVKVTGADVKEWLEMAAGQFNQIDPNKSAEQSLINNNFPTYNYDVMDGVSYNIDVTEPAKYDNDGNIIQPNANRIKNLQYAGKPIDENQEFIVATNNYRASSATYPGVKNNKEANIYPDENRQVIIDYISETGTIDPTADNNWSFSGINGADLHVTFESSPDAEKVIPENDPISFLGQGTNGFAKYSYKFPQKSNAHVKVHLLGINDFHGQLDTYNASINAGGGEYLAAYLKKWKATNPNTLLVHAGDVVGASPPTSALLQDEPTIRFLNKLGFDVGTLGNHEFDKGVQEMLRLIHGGSHPNTVEKYGPFEGANFPYVAANVIDEKTGETILDPYVIKEVDGVPIGFIGIALASTPSIVIPSGVEGVRFTDEVEAINKATAELKEKGVKAIVVLAHNPGVSKSDGTGADGEIVDIANKVDDEVDIIFGGHNHAYMNAMVGNKLLVQSYSYGTAFSAVDIEIDRTTKDIVAKKAEIVTTYRDKITPDAEIKAMIDQYKEDVAPIINEVVGHAPKAITRDQNADGESALGNLIADSMRDQTGTDFAFMNPGGIRADLKAGDLTWGDLFTVQPFGNDLVKMDLTGEQVKMLLNQQWTDKARIMPISGLKVKYDDARPVGDRILEITLPDGTPIDLAKTYSVTVNNFMASGGDNFTVLLKGKNQVVDVVDLEAFVNYVKKLKEVNTTIEGRMIKVNEKSAGLSALHSFRLKNSINESLIPLPTL